MTGTSTSSKPTALQSSERSRVRNPVTGGLDPAGRGSPLWKRGWFVVFSLLLLALVVRVLYVLHTHNFHLIEDAKSYNYLASTLAQGHGWGYGTSAYRPPGYPIFLAGIYLLVGIPHSVFTAPRLVEAVVATLTVGLIGVMTWQLAGRVAAMIALAIGAVYVPLVLVGVSEMSESLFVPLVLAATVCALQARTAMHRYRWIVAAGIFTGMASLTRGNGMLLALPLAVVVWTGRPRISWRSVLSPILLLVVTALTIMPWTIRNAYAQHAFIPVTDELGNTLKGTYNDQAPKQRFIWTPYTAANYKPIQDNKRLTEAQRDSHLISAEIHYISQHPLYVPEAMFWNTMRLLDLQGRRVSRMTARTDEDATAGFADIGVVNFWLVAAVAIFGCFTLAARRMPRSFWLVPIILWLSVAPVTTGTPRFRAALDPFVIALAAVGIQAMGAALLRWRSHSRMPGKVAPLPSET
jgi:4-amino-4-deoxy-L-arabinose transferase-like glycosyltransferase